MFDDNKIFEPETFKCIHLHLVNPNDAILLVPPADGRAQGLGVLHKLLDWGVASIMHLKSMKRSVRAKY